MKPAKLRTLSPKQIAAQRPGTWSDYDLLDTFDYFGEKNDQERMAAVLELILHSPEHSETLDYGGLYFELVQNMRWSEDYPAALRWAYGTMAYSEQRQPGLNRANTYQDIGELYMLAGELDTGLTIMARRLEADPGGIWTYNGLAITLLEIDWAELALEVLNRALEIVAVDDPENLSDQLLDFREEAIEKLAQEQGRPVEVTPAVLERLQAAMQLSPDPSSAPVAYLPPVDALISLEASDVETAYAAISAQGAVLAAELIQLAFDEEHRGTPAAEHALTLLRRLAAERQVEFAELALWLERAEGDWSRELLTRDAGKIGGYYTDELIAFANDTTYDTAVRSSIVSALVERSQKCPEQRERILENFRVLLTRPEAYEAEEETFIGFLISSLGDMGARELYPEIEAAFAEDRLDPTIIDLQNVQEDFELPVTPRPERPEDGFNLVFKCKNCGRSRWYWVHHVVIDTLTQDKAAAGEPLKYDPIITDREIICPKCGARDQYEATPQTLMQLVVPTGGKKKLAALFKDREETPPWKLRPNVQVIASAAFNRPMHPLEALERYRKLIAANPRDAEPYFRMATLLRTINRNAQALEACRQGYELGTTDPELMLNRALAEHDLGDKEAAEALYQETIQAIQDHVGDDPVYAELARVARQGQRALKRGKASPWQTTVLSESPGQRKPAWQRKQKGRRPKKKKRRR